jgi:hypothetical protein
MTSEEANALEEEELANVLSTKMRRKFEKNV